MNNPVDIGYCYYASGLQIDWYPDKDQAPFFGDNEDGTY